MRNLPMQEFSRVNFIRCASPDGFNHPLSGWSLSDWLTATVGEIGEAANVIKKLNRVRDGIKGNSESPEELRRMLANELADAHIYLDLTMQAAGFHPTSIIVDKFNATSVKIGSPIKLEV